MRTPFAQRTRGKPPCSTVASRAATLLLCGLAATGCATLLLPRGAFRGDDFHAQPPGRVILEYPSGGGGRRGPDSSRVSFRLNRQDISLAEPGAIIARPPSHARRHHDGIELDARDLWMMQRGAATPGMQRLFIAASNVRVARFPDPGDDGNLTPVDSVVVSAPGLRLRVTRAATVIVSRDTVRIAVLR